MVILPNNDLFMKISYGFQILENIDAIGWYNQWVISRFAPYLKGDILEVGCGVGSFTKLLSGFGSLWAIDISNEYLKKTKKEAPKKVKVGFGDIQKGKFFFKDKQFDTIVCLNVLEHIQDDIKALKILNKLLKPGGILILLLPTHQFLYNEIDRLAGHFRRYEKDILTKKLLQSNFEINFLKRLNFIGGVGWLLSGKIFRSSNIDRLKVKIFQYLAPPFIFLENFLEPPLGTSLLVIAKRGAVFNDGPKPY